MPETDAAGAGAEAPAVEPADSVAPAVEERFGDDAPLAVTVPNARLRDARDLALAALHEITPAASVGPAAGYLPEADGVISLRFENRLGGYPGWYWTVSVAQVGDEEPTVLEVELLPGDGALLAPEWVPWAERLADYRAHQAERAASAEQDAAGDGSDGASGDDLDADDLEEDDLDDEIDEDAAAPRLHAGDLDGVDIDELDDSATTDAEDDASEHDGESDEDEFDDNEFDEDDDDQDRDPGSEEE